MIVTYISGPGLQISMNMHIVHGTANILVDRSERHEQITTTDSSLFPCVLWSIGEEIHETGKQIGFGQIEESVENVHTRFVQLQKFIWVHLVHLRTVYRGEERFNPYWWN